MAGHNNDVTRGEIMSKAIESKDVDIWKHVDEGRHKLTAVEITELEYRERLVPRKVSF